MTSSHWSGRPETEIYTEVILMEENYLIEGMSCQSCARKIEQGLAEYAAHVRVDFAEARLYLTDMKVSFEELKNHIARLGPYHLHAETITKAKEPTFQAYYPLVLIVVYLMSASLAGIQDVSAWMRHFMGGFFLVFSFFKLLNIRKFADGYANYDLLAMRWKGYGFIYPFCELGLGLAYLFGWQLRLVLWATTLLMGFSTIGVIQSMRRNQNMRCACLGDLINVPLSTVTLAEDIGMTVMAIAMLVMEN